jgi:hypothetical protein
MSTQARGKEEPDESDHLRRLGGAQDRKVAEEDMSSANSLLPDAGVLSSLKTTIAIEVDSDDD